MQKSSFFNSISGDRKYKAEDWAQYFASLIGNGVFPQPSTGLQVVAGESMDVTVHAGNAWINGYFYANTADLTLSLSVADGVLSRIDRIVVRWDLSARSITAAVKAGDPESSPTPPALDRDADVYEICLADVLIPAGATGVSQANITDQRLNTAVCGVVAALVDQIDTTAFNSQLQAWFGEFTAQSESDFDAWQDQEKADFEAWYATVQEILDDNVATSLYNMITTHTSDTDNPHQVTYLQTGAAAAEHTHEAMAKLYSYTATLLSTGWTGEASPYSQTVTVTGMLATDKPIVDIVQTGTETTDKPMREAWTNITRITTAAGSITAYADSKPGVNLPIQMEVLR